MCNGKNGHHANSCTDTRGRGVEERSGRGCWRNNRGETEVILIESRQSRFERVSELQIEDKMISKLS